MATLQEAQALLSLISGSKGTSSVTETILTPEQIQAIVTQQMESSSGGLAATASGARTAGARGSTMNAQMINDLTTRAAANAAAKSTRTTQNSGGNKLSIGETLLSLGGLSAGMNFLEPVGKEASAAAGKAGSALVNSAKGIFSDKGIAVENPGLTLGAGWGESQKYLTDGDDVFGEGMFDITDSFTPMNELGTFDDAAYSATDALGTSEAGWLSGATEGLGNWWSSLWE